MTNDGSKFLAWLDEELRKREWSDYRLAKKANLAPSVISKARNNARPMGWKACTAIASTLHVSPQTVLELGGHLPAQPGDLFAPLRWYKPGEKMPKNDTQVLAVVYYEGFNDDVWEEYGYSIRQVGASEEDGLLVTLAVPYMDGEWYTEYPHSALLREVARINAPVIRWSAQPIPPRELLAELRKN